MAEILHSKHNAGALGLFRKSQLGGPFSIANVSEILQEVGFEAIWRSTDTAAEPSQRKSDRAGEYNDEC